MQTTTKKLSILTAKQLAEYRERGFLLLRQLFSPDECAAFRRECDRLFTRALQWDERNLRLQTRRNRAGDTVIDRLDPITDLSPPLRSAAEDQRVLGPIRDILQDGALLLKDKLVFRLPGAEGYGAHQDYTLWQQLPAKPKEMVSALLAIDACSPANGAMEMYTGMHHRPYLEPSEPQDLFNPKAGLVPEEFLADAESEVVEMSPGDILIFGSLTPHRTAPNSTDSTRRITLFTYCSESHGDLRRALYQHFHRYLRRDRIAAGMQSLHFE